MKLLSTYIIRKIELLQNKRGHVLMDEGWHPSGWVYLRQVRQGFAIPLLLVLRRP